MCHVTEFIVIVSAIVTGPVLDVSALWSLKLDGKSGFLPSRCYSGAEAPK